MTPGAWLSVATICALGAASPGPSLAVVVRHTITGSRVHGIAAALSHAAGVGIYAALTVVGLAALMVAEPRIYRAVALIGAAYLLWLGINSLRSAADNPEAGTTRPAASIGAAARDGFAIAFLNPKIAVFFLALFSQFVAPDSGALDTAILALTALAIDGGWYTLVAIGLSRPAQLAWLRRRRLWIERVTGIVLIALAVWTIVRYGAD